MKKQLLLFLFAGLFFFSGCAANQKDIRVLVNDSTLSFAAEPTVSAEAYAALNEIFNQQIEEMGGVREDIPLGSEIVIQLPEGEQKVYHLYDFLLTDEGKVRYRKAHSVSDFPDAKGEIRYKLESHPAILFSSDSDGFQPEQCYRGFMLSVADTASGNQTDSVYFVLSTFTV